MSTTTHHQSTPAAPWKAAFEEDVSSMDSPEFVLSTVTPASGASSSASNNSGLPPVLPRARFCIYRGMWAELPPNKHNDGPKNPEGIFSSDLPTFTTDVRMAKVGDLFATGAGKADREELIKGSGGGGPVEAVWWCKDKMHQWRVKGTAWVVADDVDGEVGGAEAKESSGVRSLKSEVGRRMRLQDPSREKEWKWGTELVGHFGNLSPGMRGSFKNPPPGTKANGQPSEEHKLGQKVGTDDKLSWSNFRVVIIKPDEVESVDLSDPSTGRRQSYKFVEENGQGTWTHEELWP